MEKEAAILQSWEANAKNWTNSIEQKLLESRILATNDAIVHTVLANQPKYALDLGCGEGWLSQILCSKGIKVTGVDAIASLVAATKSKCTGTFFVATYGAISRKQVVFEQQFDLIVCNFALLGKDSVDELIPVLEEWLQPAGKLIIQTLHPKSRIVDNQSGWKPGSWDGLGSQYCLPYEWYYRTSEDWIDLFNKSGFPTVETQDIYHPSTGALVSVIYTLSR